MNVSRHVEEMIATRLRERRIVVWYDPGHVFHDLFGSMSLTPLVKVDANASFLSARREADRAWRALFDSESLGPAPAPLLIYVPGERGGDDEARALDLFEPFALAGASFGAVDAERLPSIARQVLAGREAEVDRLFAEGNPSLAQLDSLASGTSYPLLLEEFGTDVPARVATRILCRPGEVGPKLVANPGLLADVRRFLASFYGFAPTPDVPAEALAPALAGWILFSEFAFETPAAVPAPLSRQPRAPEAFRTPILDLCSDLRNSAEHRDGYRDLAAEVERRLGLSDLADAALALGGRDTFPFADRAALLHVQKCALEGDLQGARTVLDARQRSVWRTVPERDQLWRLASRCLDLLDRGEAWRSRAVGATCPVSDHVRAYCAEEDGFWRLDQAQRLLEQAASLLADRDTLAPLLDHVRRRFRELLTASQDAFLDAVGRGGWPAEGYARQTAAWSRHAEAQVRDGRRLAWFLVDALRYEMGRELRDKLREQLGNAIVEPACGVLPAATAFGMAALLPGADTALAWAEQGGSLVPRLGGRTVGSAEERREVFRAVLGDRFADIRLGDLLAAGTADLRNRIGRANVLAVFSTEIDDFGERGDPLSARRYVSDVVAELLAAASRLAGLGFERIVFAADHGFMQLPEVLPGDVCAEPAGQWLLRKRRALLGTLGGRSVEVVTIPGSAMGVQGPVRDVCVPRGTKVFRAGSPYFHEGISLQECLVPLVVLDVAARQAPSEGKPSIGIHYRSNRFTTRIFSVQIEYGSILRPDLLVRVQAFVPNTDDVVGEAADCDARDPHTNLVKLSVEGRTQVPVALDSDFSGDAVEVRILDAAAPGRALASLVLRNAIME